MKKIIFTTLSLIFLFTNLSNADDNLFLEPDYIVGENSQEGIKISEITVQGETYLL